MSVTAAQRTPRSVPPGRTMQTPRPAGARAMSSPSYLSPTTPALRLGSGEPLSVPVQSRLASSFGADFSAVRIHKGGAARAGADRMGARAFTLGSNIVLGSGQSAEDLNLIGHEAAHVMHQSGGQSIQTFSIASSDPLEVEAAAAGQAVVRGEPA